ncbi:MAG TPA: hypothetical protein VF661_00765 [Actinomycetales bacterium]
MSTPLHAGLRLLRAGSVGVVVLGLAAAAHVAGHGDLPHPAILVVVAVFVALTSTLVTPRRLELPLLFGVLAASQVVLHHVLGWLASPACAVTLPAPTPGPHLGHAASAALACAAPLTGTEASAPAAAEPAVMVLAHLGAVLLAAVVLASGDRALWALLDWLRPVLGAPPRAALVVPRLGVAPLEARSRLPHQPPVLRSVRRRGPPAGRPAIA